MRISDWSSDVCSSDLSLLGLLGFPGMIAYSASKGAIRTMTKAVAMECVSNNIRVNTIVPGAMQTPIQANVTAEADAWQRAKIPMGDLGELDDIARSEARRAGQE